MNLAINISDKRNAVIISVLAIVLLMTIIFSLSTGAVSIPVGEVTAILLRRVGFFGDREFDAMHLVVMDSIRIPRIVMTVLIGAALGVSGATLQGLFRNPLVEPSLIGVSGGSAAGVVIVVVFGSSLALDKSGILYNALVPLSAFTGGLLATFLVLNLSMELRRTNIAVLILVGVAINALAEAIIGLSIFYADENQLRTFTFWTLGDLGGATTEKLMIAAPLLSLSIAMLLVYAQPLNALALGESEAYHMGVDVERVKRMIVLFSALAVSISVSLAGIIGFIGLVVPHLVRVVFDSDNRLVLPASVIGGAWLLVAADLVARTVVTPAELPIGVVTALVGSPVFIVLLMKVKRKNEL